MTILLYRITFPTFWLLFAASLAYAADVPGQDAVPLFSWSGYFHAIALMCLLLALLWLAVWAVRRSGKFNFLPQSQHLPPNALHLEMRLPLGPKKELALVHFLNKRLLLGITDQHITLLKETEICDDSQSVDSINRSGTATEQSGSSGDTGRNFSAFFSKSLTVADRYSTDRQDIAESSADSGAKSGSADSSAQSGTR